MISMALLMSVFFVLAHSCKKDDDNGENDDSITYGTFTDARDGNIYKTIKIGSQVWMAENLRFLPSVTGPETGSTITPYYYVYDYYGTNVADAKATANYTTYGVLYNFPAACSSCPDGWHLPSDAEWTQLTTYLGGENIAGGKLKETGTTHWVSPNTGATNTTGFTALPGGYRFIDNNFVGIGEYGFWRSVTEGGTDGAWVRIITYDDSEVDNGTTYKEMGLSVRCLKN